MSNYNGNQLDDASTINDDYDERSPLLSDHSVPNNSLLTTPNADTILVPSIVRYRPTNILRAFFFIEFLTLLIIWLVGKRILL